MNGLPIKAVLLDWAGTTVDFGSRAPTQVFVEIYRRRGVEITGEEARGPMGRAKHEHIALVAALPRVTEEWRRRYGAAPTEGDVRAMYDDFLPLQKEILQRGSSVIPGVPQAIDELRRRGLRIGSTTGYTRALMEIAIPIAAAGGYQAGVIAVILEMLRHRRDVRHGSAQGPTDFKDSSRSRVTAGQHGNS